MKTCSQCSQGFETTDEDRRFYDKVAPTIGGKKFAIPDPTLCPDCRLQQRLVWRNERYLYRRSCSKTGQSIISWIAPEKPHKVYKKDIWWGDSWNALDYGRDFDFSKPFFPQLEALIKEVPFLDLLVDNAFNSDYVNFCNNNKDCYLIFASNNNENCLYSSYLWGCRDCVDCLEAFDAQLCYSCIDVNNCYGCSYCKNCVNVSDSYFCENCQNCQNCFGCVNLVGKKYHFLNQPLSKEEYEKKIAGLKLDSRSRIQEARTFFNQHRLKFPMRYAQVVNCQDSSGDALRNCKNTKESYDASGAEDCKWLMIAGKPVKDCYDVTGAEATELCYQGVVIGIPATQIYFSAYAWKNVHNVLYSVLCPGSQDCFGVVGLQRGKYCILNKQYTKEEYEKLIPRIIEHMQKTGEWGQFLSPHLSPFDYNETLANEYFPLTKETVLKRGWRWRDQESKEYVPSKIQVPDTIAEATEEMAKEVLSCRSCGKNYRIIPQELQFYRTHKIAPPNLCPDCRHTARMKLRNPRKLWQRICSKCAAPIQTTYSPDRPEMVYCENCYLKEVY